MRKLPLHTVIHLTIPTKKARSPPPSWKCLRIEDEKYPLEGTTWEELAEQVQARYPDKFYERRLNRERDLHAEQAMSDLASLISRSAMRRFLDSKASGQS
jgi:hypothetical protein